MSFLRKFVFVSMIFLHCITLAGDRVLYINGIQNTRDESIYSYNRIKQYVNSSINHINRGKKNFTYLPAPIWNPTGWSRTENTLLSQAEDSVELFLLKTYEELYTAEMQKLVVPHYFPQTGNQSAFITAAGNVAGYTDLRVSANKARNSNLIDKAIPSDAMDSLNQARQNLYDALASGRGNRQIVVAHSQGNLLANLAYAQFAKNYPTEISSGLRIINVANTALTSPNGLNLTHADDAALWPALIGLPIAMPAITLTTIKSAILGKRTTSHCINEICSFDIVPATFTKGQGFVGGKDVALHSFDKVYLSSDNSDKFYTRAGNSQGVSFTLGAERPVDRFEDMVYAAANSMETSAELQCPETGEVGEKLTCTIVGKNIKQLTLSSTPICTWAEETPVNTVVRSINQNKINGMDTFLVDEGARSVSGYWEDLGVYTINNISKVTLYPSARGKVIADAVRLIPIDSTSVYTPPVDGPGVINLDSNASIRTGQWDRMWETDGTIKFYSGANYYGHAPSASSNDKATWYINQSGRYEVSIRWQAKDNRASDAIYTIYTGGTRQDIKIDQRRAPPGWQSLGIHTFQSGGRIELSPSATGKVVTGDIKLTPLSNARMMPLVNGDQNATQYVFDVNNGNKLGEWISGYSSDRRYNWWIHNPIATETTDEFYWNVGATGLSGKYLVSVRWKTAVTDTSGSNMRDTAAKYKVEATADSSTARQFSCAPTSAGKMTVSTNTDNTPSVNITIIQNASGDIPPLWTINQGDQLYAIQIKSVRRNWSLPSSFPVDAYLFTKSFRGLIHQGFMTARTLSYANTYAPPANCQLSRGVFPGSDCGFLGVCALDTCQYIVNGQSYMAQARIWRASEISCPPGKLLLAGITDYFSDSSKQCVDPYCYTGTHFDFTQGQCVADSAKSLFMDSTQSTNTQDTQSTQSILDKFINLILH